MNTSADAVSFSDLSRNPKSVAERASRLGRLRVTHRDAPDFYLTAADREDQRDETLTTASRSLSRLRTMSGTSGSAAARRYAAGKSCAVSRWRTPVDAWKPCDPSRVPGPITIGSIVFVEISRHIGTVATTLNNGNTRSPVAGACDTWSMRGTAPSGSSTHPLGTLKTLTADSGRRRAAAAYGRPLRIVTETLASAGKV
jgi:hypothetical protein